MWAYELIINLYRVFCQPTSFSAQAREMGFKRRGSFMVRMAPVMLITAALTVGSLSVILQTIGFIFHWRPHGFWWMPAIWSILAGVAVGSFWSVTAGTAAGFVWGPAHWLIGSVLLPIFHTIPDGTKTLIGVGAPLGLALGVGMGVTIGTRKGALWGLILGALFGIISSATNPLPGLIAFASAFLFGYFRLEWYAVDVEVTLLQLVRAYHRPARARAYLHGSPIYWREPIWPPLLGLRSFLRLIGDHDYQAGVDECLFVISERPTQAQVARVALMHVVTRHLARLDTIQKIATAGAEVERPVAQGVQLPEMLQAALPELSVLTRFAEQHLSATLPYNRRRALQRLSEGADDLGRRLALEDGPVPRMLLSVTRAWRDIALARLDEIAAADKSAGFVHNPFVFGQPIEETETNLFVGRRDVVREIEVSLLGGSAKPTLVLWGPRRMGKTSVLLQLPRLLGSEFVPAFLDAQAMQVRENVGAFFHSITASASAALHRRGIPMPSLSAADLAENPFSVFAAWIENVEERLGSQRHLLLCLDEFERLEASIREGRLPQELLDQFRHIIQHHARIVLLFAGSHRPDEMVLNWPDILISTKLIRVSYLHEQEARQLVTQPVPEFEVSYTPESVDGILTQTRCQPYLIQAVCYELINHLNMEGRKEATVADVELVTEHALESAHLYFAEMWRQLDENMRSITRAMSQSQGGIDVPHLAAEISADPEAVEAGLRTLAGRSIIEHDPVGHWRFQVPMVAEWVRTRGGG